MPTSNPKDEELIDATSEVCEIDPIRAEYSFEDVTTMEIMRRPYSIPSEIDRSHGYSKKYHQMLADGNFGAVDHGEFQQCADKLLSICAKSDGGSNLPEVLCLQNSRQGGKTFMMTAIASILEKTIESNGEDSRVIFITMSGETKLSPQEAAIDAVLSRMAYVLENSSERSFQEFRDSYSDFDAVWEWAENNNGILMIDDLSMIETRGAEYKDLILFFDSFVGRQGSALLYSAHHTLQIYRHHSMRKHCWQPMPRLRTETCMHQLGRGAKFGSAVIRGRIPGLLALGKKSVDYLNMAAHRNVTSRHLMVNAILDGNIRDLEDQEKDFCSSSFLIKNKNGLTRHVWPPFLCARALVLHKTSRELQRVLEARNITTAEAFKALAVLAVSFHLVSTIQRCDKLVPQHPQVTPDNAFAATAILEIDACICTIHDLRIAVEKRLAQEKEKYDKVLQIVVFPTNSSFSIYDFFVFHRHQGLFGRKHWKVAAGYNCSSGTKYPREDDRIRPGLAKSVWIEGRSTGPRKVVCGKSRQWVLVPREAHQRFFGESLYAAFSDHCSDRRCQCCV